MKYFYNARKVLSVAFIAAGVALCILTTPNAHAKILTGGIEAQYVCHDGANRGATIRLLLSKFSRGLIMDYVFADLGPKTYYTRTSCIDLQDYTNHKYGPKLGKYFYAWYTAGLGTDVVYRCIDFHIVYVKNGKKVWVQNGGRTFWSMTCVAKDKL